MLTGRQIRDARAILHWNRNSLAKRSAVPVSVIQRAESDDGEVDIAIAHAIVIKHALITAGVEFTLDRPRLRHNQS